MLNLGGGGLEPTFVTSALCFGDGIWVFARDTNYPPVYSPCGPKVNFTNANLTLSCPHCHVCRMSLLPSLSSSLLPVAVTSAILYICVRRPHLPSVCMSPLKGVPVCLVLCVPRGKNCAGHRVDTHVLSDERLYETPS